MFLSTQRLEEEKLGKVERKVEPEKNKQLQVGVCLRTVGRSSAFSSSCPTLVMMVVMIMIMIMVKVIIAMIETMMIMMKMVMMMT